MEHGWEWVVSLHLLLNREKSLPISTNLNLISEGKGYITLPQRSRMQN